MSLNQEDIIKDKLLDYEIPFEEKYWEDFRDRLKKDTDPKKVGIWYNHKYQFIAFTATLLFVSLFLLKKEITIPFLQNPSTFSGENRYLNNNTKSDLNHSNVQSNQIQQKNKSTNQKISKDSNFNSTPNKSVTVKSNSNANAVNKDQSNVSLERSVLSATESSNNNSKLGKGNQVNTALSEKNNLKNSAIDSKAQNDANQNNSRNWNTNSTSNATSNNSNGSSFISDNNSQNDAFVTGIYATLSENAKNQLPLSKIDAPINHTYGVGMNDDYGITSLVKEKSITEQVVYSNALVDLEKMMLDLPSPEKGQNEIYHTTQDVDWKTARLKRWEVGAYGGIVMIFSEYQGEQDLLNGYKKDNLPNFTAGAYFSYAFHKRLTFETAFQYKGIDNSFAVKKIRELADETYNYKITESSVVSRLRSLEIPIGINYKLNNWLYLSSGLSFAYVKPIKAIHEREEINLNEGQSLDDIVLLNSKNNYGINKFDARIYAGVNFHVSPFLGFKFVVNQGLTDRTNNDYYSTNQYNLHTDYAFTTIIRLNPKVLK